MSITIELEPEPKTRFDEKDTGESGDDTAFENALAALRNRTPEQIAEARARVLDKSRRAKPLPPGKTLEDMVFGKWPGNETDKEINAALEELS